MNADRIQIQEGPSQVFQNRKGESTQLMEDNRVQSVLQAKMVETMQRDAMDEDDLQQGKFAVQRDVEDEDSSRKICGPTANEEPDRDSGLCNPRHGVFLRDGFLFGTCTPGFIESAGGWGFGIYARYGYPFRPGTIQTGYVCRTAAIGT